MGLHTWRVCLANLEGKQRLFMMLLGDSDILGDLNKPAFTNRLVYNPI